MVYGLNALRVTDCMKLFTGLVYQPFYDSNKRRALIAMYTFL